jgi:DNA-binding GntR family transcriptional regulator
MNKNLFLPSFENNETLPEKICASLENAILQGKIKPGERLIEDSLSRSFKVSRAPIREALRLLEKEGLIKRLPRRGAVVESISLDTISDICEVRSVLEGLAARLFCQRASDEEIQRMEQIYERMKQSLDHLQYRKLNREFHDLFINGCGNKNVKDLCENFQKRKIWFERIILSSQGRPEISLKEHEGILGGFKKRDAQEVEAEVRLHMERAADIYLKAVSERVKNTNKKTPRAIEEIRREKNGSRG